MPGGKPLIFKTPEDLQEAVDSYFDHGGEAWVRMPDGEMVFMPTMSGLALALGVDRKTITNYSYRDEYFPTIKKARSLVEQTLERRLYLNNPTGVIFNLKNNFGWTDDKNLNHSSPDGSMTPRESVDSSLVKALVDKLTD